MYTYTHTYIHTHTHTHAHTRISGAPQVSLHLLSVKAAGKLQLKDIV